MAVIENIGNGAKSALNVGLGLYKSVEARVQEIQSEIEQTYKELVVRGAADSSEVAVGIRSNLDRGIAAVRETQTKVESVVKK